MEGPQEGIAMESLGLYPTWDVPYVGSGWVMGFIYALGLGYTCWFVFSLRNKEGASSGGLLRGR